MTKPTPTLRREDRQGSRPPLRILLLANRFPPQAGAGVQRPLKLVKAWSRLGCQVAVITSQPDAFEYVDQSLADEIPDAVRVVTVPDRGPILWVERLRRSVGERTRWLARSLQRLHGLLVQISVPDARSGWFWPAFSASRGLDRQFKADVIVATGPPFTPFVLGAALSKSLGVPLVLDYRDPWTASYFDRKRGIATDAISPRLERWVLRNSAGVVAAHRGILRYLGSRFGIGERARPRTLWIPNGYDPDDFPEDDGQDQDRFVLTYTGSLWTRRTPAVLLQVLRELLEEGAISVDRFRLRMAGRLKMMNRLVEAGGNLEQIIEILGYVDHPDSLALAGDGTANLVIVGDWGGPNLHSPGKVYEVMRTRRPVLLLSPEGVTTRLARRVGGCWIAHPEDRSAIRETLLALYGAWQDGSLVQSFERPHLEFYDRNRQAARYLAFLQDVVDRARPLPRQSRSLTEATLQDPMP